MKKKKKLTTTNSKCSCAIIEKLGAKVTLKTCDIKTKCLSLKLQKRLSAKLMSN